jgi:hypothetical protein
LLGNGFPGDLRGLEDIGTMEPKAQNPAAAAAVTRQAGAEVALP